MHLPYLDKVLKQFQITGTNVLILLSVFVGLMTGLGALGFVKLISYSSTGQIFQTQTFGATIADQLPIAPLRKINGVLATLIEWNYSAELG